MISLLGSGAKMVVESVGLMLSLPNPLLYISPRNRIAWPGGKIVSNKDEALANFLRRKLDQGQTLTPEQVSLWGSNQSHLYEGFRRQSTGK